jgi:hypothetical protein
MLRNTAEQDVAKAFADIEKERDPNEWVSGHPSSQAILMAKKRQDRMRDGANFHGFILTQASKDDTEFSDFITQLKDKVSKREIKPGTRIHLDVITTYMDLKFDADLYEKGHRECNHWTPIDLLIEENGSVSSVVLDASDSFGHRRMHSELKATFPDSEHYIFRGDTYVLNQQSKVRKIQTQPIGCRVFSIEHAKQLSQIPAATLRSELKDIANESGVFTPGSMKEGTNILRVLRGMQTVNGLQSLSPEVRRSPIGRRKSLMQTAETTIENGVNTMVTKRSTRYKQKKRDYFELLAPGELLMIMENKSGLAYLHYPFLFTLSDALTTASRESVDEFLAALKKNCADQNVDSPVMDLVDAGKSIEMLKSKMLLRLESSFLKFERNGEFEKCQRLIDILQAALPLLKLTQFRSETTYLSADTLFQCSMRKSSFDVKGRNIDVAAPSEKTIAVPTITITPSRGPQ